MGAIIRDPRDNRKLARVGTFADGERLGDGLTANAIIWVKDAVNGIHRRLRSDQAGRLFLSMSHGAAAYSFETITVSGASIGITQTLHTSEDGHLPAVRAYMTLEGGQVRYRYDGTDPTNAVGHLLDANSEMELEGSENIQRFRAIRTGGIDGKLTVTLER